MVRNARVALIWSWIGYIEHLIVYDTILLSHLRYYAWT